jgi:hypothetical protein
MHRLLAAAPSHTPQPLRTLSEAHSITVLSSSYMRAQRQSKPEPCDPNTACPGVRCADLSAERSCAAWAWRARAAP